MKSNMFKAIVFSVFILLFFCQGNAYAYLDPGSGSLFFQFLIAGILSALFMLKVFFKRIVSKINLIFRKKR